MVGTTSLGDVDLANESVHLGNGTFRDTVVFSILADEWPDVRKRLLARISG